MPAGTYAAVTLLSEDDEGTYYSLKVDEGAAVRGDYALMGPGAWQALFDEVATVELLHVPGGMPVFDPGPTLTYGELTTLLGTHTRGKLLRMVIAGEQYTPGRPFHHPSGDGEVSLGIAAMRQSVGDFLDQLTRVRILHREPSEPLEIADDMPVRIRDSNARDDDAWSITGLHVDVQKVYLDLA